MIGGEVLKRTEKGKETGEGFVSENMSWGFSTRAMAGLRFVRGGFILHSSSLRLLTTSVQGLISHSASMLIVYYTHILE